jgi:4,5-dihydroxyphthalate decarboxylase
MSQKIELTLACGDYEITRPLIDGIVRPDGIELTILTGMDSTTRHWRFLRNREFDVAEVSASSYLIARDQGQPFRAIPVFPHRRFRHGFAFVNTGKGIRKPSDLIGRKVGVKSFQVTAILWLRGILEHEYGVPHKSIEWVTEFDEDVEFTPPPGLKITRVPHTKSLETMLLEGEIDALFDAYLIKPFTAKDPRVGRLFPDYKQEEIAYVRRTGIFPIMHVLGLRQEIVDRHPWVAINLFQAFNQAKALAMKRMENPRIAPIAWYREAWEEQEAILGRDPWAYGLTEQNRKTIETLAGYSHEQGLIKRLPPLEELFLSVSQGRKRGDEFRV